MASADWVTERKRRSKIENRVDCPRSVIPDYLVVHFGVILLDYASRTSGLDKASRASQKFYRHNGIFSSELLLGVQISEFNDDEKVRTGAL